MSAMRKEKRADVIGRAQAPAGDQPQGVQRERRTVAHGLYLGLPMARTSTPARASQRARQAFTRKLLAWWRPRARRFAVAPNRDPYRVLVSEFMLQQTQVSRVAEYYPRFLSDSPISQALARASAPGGEGGLGWPRLLRASFEISTRLRAWSVGTTAARCLMHPTNLIILPFRLF